MIKFGVLRADIDGISPKSLHFAEVRLGTSCWRTSAGNEWPGDSVTDVRRDGAIIAYGNVRHIWKRIPTPSDGSIAVEPSLVAQSEAWRQIAVMERPATNSVVVST